MLDQTDCQAAQSHLEARQQMARVLGPELKRLTCLNPFKRVGELLVFTGLLAFSWHCPWQPISFVASAVAFNAFVLLIHEGMHGLLFSHKGVNRWVSVALGGFIFLSHSAYQVMHERHHRYLGDPRDPDDYDNYFSSPRAVWLMHFVRLGAGSFLYLALIPYLALRHGSSQARRAVLQEYAFLALLNYLVWTHFDSSWLLQHWVLPAAAVAVFTNLRGLTQHGIADAHDPFLASRSVHVHPFVAFLLLNENFHLEHHLFPEVPSYNLPRLHSLIYPELPRAVVNRGYGEFLWSFLKATPRLDRTPIGLVHPKGQTP